MSYVTTAKCLLLNKRQVNGKIIVTIAKMSRLGPDIDSTNFRHPFVGYFHSGVENGIQL